MSDLSTYTMQDLVALAESNGSHPECSQVPTAVVEERKDGIMQPEILKDEVQKHTVELMDWVVEAVKSGGNMLAREAPEVAREIVAWKAAEATTELVIMGLIVATIAGAWMYLGRKKWAVNGDSTSFGVMAILLAFLTFMLSIPMVMTATDSIKTVVKCRTAPRLVVLDEVRRMVGK